MRLQIRVKKHLRKNKNLKIKSNKCIKKLNCQTIIAKTRNLNNKCSSLNKLLKMAHQQQNHNFLHNNSNNGKQSYHKNPKFHNNGKQSYHKNLKFHNNGNLNSWILKFMNRIKFHINLIQLLQITKNSKEVFNRVWYLKIN